MIFVFFFLTLLADIAVFCLLLEFRLCNFIRMPRRWMDGMGKEMSKLDSLKPTPREIFFFARWTRSEIENRVCLFSLASDEIGTA
jgi:hypothetical protein